MTSPTTMTTAPTELLKIGDFARLADTNLRTLRYYEELGLMAPASRSEGGFRYYRRSDLNRLNMIRSLQELGLHLDQIRELLGSRENGADRAQLMARVRKALLVQDRLLEERIAEIGRQREKIQAAMGKLCQCETCLHTPSADNNFCEPCSTTGQALPEKVSALF